MPSVQSILRIITLSVFIATWPVSAEIVTDGSLGPLSTLQGPDYQIGAELGQQRESNLFHSFTSFNLLTSETATFSGPDTIEHIIGRVTGGAASNVSGVIKSTIPGSQIWMINPDGWTQLGQVESAGGLASAAAEAVRLKDGGLFRATQPELSQLTAASPQAFLGVRDHTELKDFSEQEMHNSQEEVEEVEDVGNIYLPTMRRDLRPETNDCSVRSYKELSHFSVSHYRGMPAVPDSWSSSTLPPLGYEGVPQAKQVAAVADDAKVRVSCNSSRCGIWENLPTP